MSPRALSRSLQGGATTVADRRRWLTLYVVSTIAGFLLLGISDANVALPSIASSLNVGPSSLQLISAGYVVTFGLTVVPFGRLGDQGHRRRLLLGGLLLYLAASLLCGLAPEWRMLIAGRILLGVSAGILMPQAMGVIQQLFRGAERGRAFGAFGVAVAVSTAAGPGVGGLLVTLGGHGEGWRWIFLMNIPVGVVLLAASLRLVPNAPATQVLRRGFDPVGIGLLGAAVLLLLYPFILTTGQPGDSSDRWFALVPAAALVVCFYSWERRYATRGRLPLVDGQLFRTPSYRNAMVIAMIWLACGPGVTLTLMLFLQLGLGLTPIAAALIVLPASVGAATGARWAAPRVGRLGRALTVSGLGISAAGMAGSLCAALTLPKGAAIGVIAASQTLNGFGSGLVIAPNNVLLLSHVPPEQASLAASIGHLTQRIGNSVGIAATSAALYSLIFGAVGSLSGASHSVYVSALAAGYGTAGLFLLLALGAATGDLLRLRKAGRLAATPQPAALGLEEGVAADTVAISG